MSGKVDRRVRRTRQAIHRALVELVLEKGYDGVTVTDIIERADVGRSTFYAHFTGKQEVLFGDLGGLAFLHPAPSTDGPLLAFTLPVFEHVADERSLVRALLGRRGGAAIVARGEQMLARVVREEFLARGAAPSVFLDLTVTCVVGAFMGLLREWADGDTTTTPADLDAAFRAVVIPGVEAVLARR
ncbi:TetR/AcrR family transcriptional regulator [Sphaerisporangium sp. TRM90804]|uniref:TetR/AcrR family transcriptional regulator n=1 Tax=Sphaerisporangium sp. TRM90804 TaxID=3031113 RepID=UPI00244D229F|nr:TetR/AcrR family transcriptional regulator [Sphaerisporangium sp. TRM90804]MDH2425420.1 TetR/AcrR family transcriptional regulator [Sphaerisporangium sp. TRM90804]